MAGQVEQNDDKKEVVSGAEYMQGFAALINHGYTPSEAEEILEDAVYRMENNLPPREA